ncbi:MAG: response regulator [Gammaproteobacteria bacterium]|nr:response regulator [Gammaproteobacteria bacterium]
MIVDDNDDNRYTLSEYLKREGFTNLATAENGQIALDKLKDADFDLVLLDLQMPVMDGIETLRGIKSDDNLRHIPVIMISAAEEIENVTQCIEIGAEGYLPKPFNPKLLRARINASLKRKKLHEDSYITYVEEGKKQADQLRIADELKATKYARIYFRFCMFFPIVAPLPFLLFKGEEGLSTLFIGSLVFGMPPYILFFLLPFLFLIGKMTEKQIIIGVIFFPLIYPLVFGLFWLIVPYFISPISSVSIKLTGITEWVFISIVIPASYAVLFLSGYFIRKLILENR